MVGVEVIQQAQEHVVVNVLELHFFVVLLASEAIEHQGNLLQVLASIVHKHTVGEDCLATNSVFQVAVLRIVHEPLEVKGEAG